MSSNPLEVVVGSIGRAHGIRGEVAITLRTDEPDRRFAVGQVLREEDGTRTFHVDSTRWHGERLLVCFAELVDRTAAEQARGTVLVTTVDADEAPDDEDEYYDRQLVGLTARCDGVDVGTVTDVVHLAAQDLLAIRTAEGERLVPFVSEIVPVVDVRGGFVEIADIPGLLHEDAAEGEAVDATTANDATASGNRDAGR